MKFDLITIFPEYFDSIFNFGVINRAKDDGLISIHTHDIRDYTSDKHRTVDDPPYGGGGGMVFKPEPVCKAIESAVDGDKKNLVILTSPHGQPLTTKLAKELGQYEQLVIVCGRYEGIDERIKELYIDKEISLGDFIISGGELAASAIVDAVARFIPGVLGNEMSPYNESFSSGLLEYPQYTRPEEYHDFKVPGVLLSGNHREIDLWRRRQSLNKTFKQRPDLLDQAHLTTDDYEYLDELKTQYPTDSRVYIALVHYPVYNKRLSVIATAFTNLDVHDIARAATTYGVKKFFLVHPIEEQQKLVRRVIDHWKTRSSLDFNPSRHEALKSVDIQSTLDDVKEEIKSIEGRAPKLIVTDARIRPDLTPYGELRDEIREGKDPYLILFGTGWGLTNEIIESSDYVLKPLRGLTDYNHLSVRSAASIILDRLLAE